MTSKQKFRYNIETLIIKFLNFIIKQLLNDKYSIIHTDLLISLTTVEREEL